MGIKESFAQAVRELTGSGSKEAEPEKEKEKEKKSLPVEELEKAVEELKKAVDDDGAQPVHEAIQNVVVGEDDIPPIPEGMVFATAASATAENADKAAGTAAAAAVDDFPVNLAVPAPLSNFQRPVVGADGASDRTIVSKTTTVYGDIRSFDDMLVAGGVKGDVETTKNVELNGKIVGNVTCNNALMHTSQVKGNIRMKGNVNMQRDALLIGDLMSTYADVSGKVKGNLDIAGKVELKGDSVVFGDINASTITVEDGAVIQGYVNTTFLNKEDSVNWFPETIIIDTGA